MKLAMACLLVGLSIANPANAQQANRSSSISATDRQQGAAANPQLIAQFGGAYTGPQAAFVERVGKRVATRSGLSNATGDFVVTTLDSPVENAFAIPGGYIYITRQLLALMNSEAELASVLGHEVGHVAARHANSRNTRSTIGALLAAGAAAVTKSDVASRVVGTGAQLYTLRYGRNQEYEADALGIRYMTAAGYDPFPPPTYWGRSMPPPASAHRQPGRPPGRFPPGHRPIPMARIACVAPSNSQRRRVNRKSSLFRTRHSSGCSMDCPMAQRRTAS